MEDTWARWARATLASSGPCSTSCWHVCASDPAVTSWNKVESKCDPCRRPQGSKVWECLLSGALRVPVLPDSPSPALSPQGISFSPNLPNTQDAEGNRGAETLKSNEGKTKISRGKNVFCQTRLPFCKWWKYLQNILEGKKKKKKHAWDEAMIEIAPLSPKSPRVIVRVRAVLFHLCLAELHTNAQMPAFEKTFLEKCQTPMQPLVLLKVN